MNDEDDLDDLMIPMSVEILCIDFRRKFSTFATAAWPSNIYVTCHLKIQIWNMSFILSKCSGICVRNVLYAPSLPE